MFIAPISFSRHSATSPIFTCDHPFWNENNSLLILLDLCGAVRTPPRRLLLRLLLGDDGLFKGFHLTPKILFGTVNDTFVIFIFAKSNAAIFGLLNIDSGFAYSVGNNAHHIFCILQVDVGFNKGEHFFFKIIALNNLCEIVWSCGNAESENPFRHKCARIGCFNVKSNGLKVVFFTIVILIDAKFLVSITQFCGFGCDALRKMTYLCYLLAFIFALTLQRVPFTFAKIHNIWCLSIVFTQYFVLADS